ncbi:MAG: hypothetical protein PWP08_564 [Methanofollis sp.]|nr:hypothetical protein [Methanofollis sp.]
MIPVDPQDVAGVLGWMEHIRPSDLAERFAADGGFDASSFRPCIPEFSGHVSAVDGSNATVLTSGSFSVAIVRAVESTYIDGERAHAGESPLRAFRIGPEPQNSAYPALYAECFDGALPAKPLDNEDRSQAASVLRDTLEYWTALRLAESLDAGDVLLLDGALRVSHESHRPILMDILRCAAGRGVLVAAVTKAAASTWGNGIPLVPAAAALARRIGVPGPWYLEIPSGIGDGVRHREWDFGATYVGCLHPRARHPFKVDLPVGTFPDEAVRTFSALAAYADDGRVTGYPFPLFDAHRMAAITADQTGFVRQQMIGAMARQGMTNTDYQEFFGDMHDEFARY